MDLKMQEIQQIKSKLPQNSYAIIAGMLGGAYKPRTIEAMFREPNLKSARKMKPEVLETTKNFLSSINIKF